MSLVFVLFLGQHLLKVLHISDLALTIAGSITMFSPQKDLSIARKTVAGESRGRILHSATRHNVAVSSAMYRVDELRAPQVDGVVNCSQPASSSL